MYCLSTFCSVCLERGKELQGLHTLDVDDIPILNKLIFVCFGHEPIDINTLKFICKSCTEILRSSYQFKRMSLLNNDVLRGYISQLKYFTGTKGTYGNTVVSLTRTEYVPLNVSDVVVDEEAAAGPSKVIKKVSKPSPQMSQCKVCKLTFRKSISRLIHFNKYHNNKTSNKTPKYLVLRGINGYNCQYCSKVISTKSRLFQHFITHKEVNNITCDYCPMVCYLKQGYEEHVCEDHGVKINKFCSICNKVVPEYLEHMSEHITPRIKCPYCTREFFTERSCKYHVNIDHWKYQCSLCNKLCFSESSVSDHIKSHNATFDIMKPLPVADNQTQSIDFNALLHDQSEGLRETKSMYKKPGPKSKTLNQTKTSPPPKKKKNEVGYKYKSGPKCKKIVTENVRKKIKLMGPKSRRAKIAATENISQQVENETIIEEKPPVTTKTYQTKMDQYIHDNNMHWQSKKVYTSKHLKRDSQVKCTHCLITFASSKSLITHKCFSSNTYQCPKCKVVYMARKSFRKHMLKCLRPKLNQPSSEKTDTETTQEDMPISSTQSDNSLDTNGVVVKQEPFLEDTVKEEVGNDCDTQALSLNPFSQFSSDENEQNAVDVATVEDNYSSGTETPAVVNDPLIDNDEVTPMEVDIGCEIVPPNEKNNEDQQNSFPLPNDDLTIIPGETNNDIIDLSSEQIPEIRIKTEFPNCDAPDSTVPEIVESSNSSSPTVESGSPNQNKESPDNLNTVINHNFRIVLLNSAGDNLPDASNADKTPEIQTPDHNSTNLSCNMCDAKFPTVALLTSHRLVHSYQTSMKCITCKKLFLSQYDLDRHIMLTYRTGCGENRRN